MRQDGGKQGETGMDTDRGNDFFFFFPHWHLKEEEAWDKGRWEQSEYHTYYYFFSFNEIISLYYHN